MSEAPATPAPEAPAAPAPAAPAAPATPPPEFKPVKDGGKPLSLREGANALAGFNLLDDDTPAAPETPAPQAGEEDQTAAPEAEQAQPEPEASETPDGEAKDTQQAESAEAEQTPLESLAQLAEALEVDLDFLGQLQHTFRADGEEVTVPLSELTSGYQRDANYRRQTQELADTRRTLEAESQQQRQAYEGQLAQLGAYLQQAKQLMVGDLNTEQMAQLRQTNPAEWAARREEYGQRINAVDQLYAHTAEQFEISQAQQAEQMQAQAAEFKRQQMDKLRTYIPEWGDDLNDKLNGYLKGDQYGFTPEEIGNFYDARHLVIANKARLYDEMMAASKQTRQKVTALPKVQKPGKPTADAPSRQTANFKRGLKKLKESGRLSDAADLIGYVDEV